MDVRREQHFLDEETVEWLSRDDRKFSLPDVYLLKSVDPVETASKEKKYAIQIEVESQRSFPKRKEKNQRKKQNMKRSPDR